MTHTEARERVSKLRKEIDHYRYEYHVLDHLSISEAALDALKHELYKLEQEFPDLITPDSPTQRVAGKALAGFKKVRHEIPMLSIEDAFSREEAEAWVARLTKLRPSAFDPKGMPREGFFAELKMDGLAMSLVYQDGVFIEGSTRGDGLIGEDVTANLRTIEAIPLRLRTPDEHEVAAFLKKHHGNINAREAESFLLKQKGRIEIRGEAFMSKRQLDDLNKILKKRGEPELANPRNAAAGSIRQLDPKIVAERRLSFFGYAMFGDHGAATHEQIHEMIALLGVPQNSLNHRAETLEEVEHFHQSLFKKRDSMPYWFDGIVVNVNSQALFEALGVVGKTPRGVIAWKFPAEQGTTIVREILVSVGRTGALTPVAVMDPVSLMGTTVTHASLHNEDEIERLGLKIGDTVIVEKAGDVIPKIVQVLPKLRTGKEKPFHMPKTCPMCGSPVKRKPGEVATMCSNRNCFAQELAKLLHFVGQSAFDIRGIGDRIAEQLIQRGLVNEPADIFRLKAGDFLTLEGFADLSSEKLEREIQSHRRIPLDRFINALGIRHVGERTASDLAKAFGSIEALKDASKEELLSVAGIGEVVADAIVEFFAQEHHRKELEHLLRFVEVERAKKLSGPLTGTTWVITGTLDALSREEAKEKIRALGGQVSESVSKQISFVVVGAEPGSKYEKAQKLGIPILDEKSFLKKIE
ncbi:MAG TPA: NAD-dependent DNA ligase LigA [Patescibacteria group bacterium]|nr:NAD-dependent DNA ligase LigA [Patescibacteria group bacterium]